MNPATLADLYKLLPEADQETALINSIELIFARSEWPLLNDLLPHMLSLEGHESVRAHALSIGAKAALRLGQPDLAFARCQNLLEFGKSQINIRLQVEALYQLAIQILPGRAERLMSMWGALDPDQMPKETAELWARIGVLLCGTVSKNREEENAKTVTEKP